MRNIGIAISLALSAFATYAAEEKAAALIYRDTQTRGLLSSRSYVQMGPSVMTFGESISKMPTFNDTWCYSVTLNYWSNARHPGNKYSYLLNQDQNGIGIKCRQRGSDPLFFSADGMINSQGRTSGALSVGKQVDLIEIERVKLYVGASLTALSYERPPPKTTVYGIAPFRHRGVSLEMPWKLGTLSWEEQTLPVDNIKLRSWNLKIGKTFNIF